MRDWDDLRFLLAVHRAGSLGGAADNLRVDKATVGRRLAALGEALGIRLVERVGPGYRITREAASVVEAAEAVETTIVGLEETLAGDVAKGAVRLTVPAFFARVLLIPALPAFRQAWPDVELKLLTSDRLLDLGRREADVALRNVQPSQIGLSARRVGPIAYSLYGALTYIEARGLPTTRAELAGHHLVAGEREPVIATGFRWLFDAGTHVAFRASDMGAQHEAVRAGVGLGVLSCVVGDEDASLRRVPAAGRTTDDVFAVHPEELGGLARIRAVVDFLEALFRDNARRLVPE